MSECAHEFWERESSVETEGLCALCLRARVAELEAHIAALEDALKARTDELYPDLQARVAELVTLLCRVVRHGDASGDRELIAAIMAATPEAGWTDQSAVLNAPANATESEVMPNRSEDGDNHLPESGGLDIATPRPAHSPAGAVLEILQRHIHLTASNGKWRVKPSSLEYCAERICAVLGSGAPR